MITVPIPVNNAIALPTSIAVVPPPPTTHAAAGGGPGCHDWARTHLFARKLNNYGGLTAAALHVTEKPA